MKKALSLLLCLLLTLSLAACGNNGSSSSQASPAGGSSSSSSEPVSSAASEPVASLPAKDRSGAEITVPEKINSMVVLAPSIVEMVVAMGQGDKIIGHDTQSTGLEGLKEGLPAFDLTQPDVEQLMALKPDVLFMSNMTFYDDSEALNQLKEAGTCVITIPSSESIEEVKNDIAFVASVLGAQQEGETILAKMQAELDRISAIGKTITEKKKVYFEIAAAPSAYSFGSGVFLNEMIELIGAENILADQPGWLAVELENVVAANPDVILTNVNYLEDPVGEILSRDGWNAVTAVSQKQVYAIDNMASSLANQNIVKALDQMAKAVYPEQYN